MVIIMLGSFTIENRLLGPTVQLLFWARFNVYEYDRPTRKNKCPSYNQHCKELVFIIKPEGFSAVTPEQKTLKGFDWRQNCCRTFNEKWRFCKILFRKLCLPLLLKCPSYVYPPQDPMMDGSLGCWDNGLMGDQWNARFLSRAHITPFISNYEVSYPQGGEKAILTKEYYSGPRRRLP